MKDIGKVLGALLLVLILVGYNMYERWEKARYKRLYEGQVATSQSLLVLVAKNAAERDELQKLLRGLPQPAAEKP